MEEEIKAMEKFKELMKKWNEEFDSVRDTFTEILEEKDGRYLGENILNGKIHGKGIFYANDGEIEEC